MHPTQGLDLISLHFLLSLTKSRRFSLNLQKKKLKIASHHVLEAVDVVVVEVEVLSKTIVQKLRGNRLLADALFALTSKLTRGIS